MSLIEVEGVRHRYQVGDQSVWALDGVSLTVESGEFLAVTGPSGSGKSTFMHILGLLDRPTSGSYRLGGSDIRHLHHDALAAMRNRFIGFVFQSFNLLPRTSALENVELPMIYSRVRAEARRRRAWELLEKVGLAARAGHTPAELSGGQQQRVAIARALANEPLVLLADEPTGALDSQSGRDIMTLFHELNREGLTVVVVTHEPEVAAYANRNIAFRDGRIVSDCLRRPDLAGSDAARGGALVHGG
jgi:putative ABC transport system ATP-binding protein